MDFGPAEAARLVPLPKADTNKYRRGVLAVFAGSARFPGAAVLAAQAAPRCGAGYTTLAVPAPAAATARAHLASVPVRALDADGQGCFCPEALPEAEHMLEKAGAFLMGPGLGRSEACDAFVMGLLGSPLAQEKTAVIDADALNAIAENREAFFTARPEGCQQILTPHEGEAARLLGHKVEDRLRAAQELAAAWRSTVVLKGPETIIAGSQGAVKICRNAGPELAKAGSGDVLAGMVGAFCAQGLQSVDAACLAVYLHGKAGALAAADLSTLSVMPEDLPGYIGKAVRSLEAWDPSLADDHVKAADRAMAR